MAKNIKLGAYDGAPAQCSVPGCGRPTTRAAGNGVDDFHCRYHVQLKARHGSPFARTYRAPDLKPYLWAARRWITANEKLPAAQMALAWLGGILADAGPAEEARDIKGKPAAERAKVAFARLREAGVEPRRMLTIHMAVSALIEDDRDSHRVEEFRVVQVAKALHRLASGTHKEWDFPLNDGRTTKIKHDTYPMSRGQVLRLIGRPVDEACSDATEAAIPEIIAIRGAKFGLHPSQLPGWVPAWQRKRQAGG